MLGELLPGSPVLRSYLIIRIYVFYNAIYNFKKYLVDVISLQQLAVILLNLNMSLILTKSSGTHHVVCGQSLAFSSS